MRWIEALLDADNPFPEWQPPQQVGLGCHAPHFMPILCASAPYCVRVVVFKTFFLYFLPSPMLLTVGVRHRRTLLNPAPKKREKNLSNLGQGVKCFIAVVAVVTGLFMGGGVLFSVCLQWPAVLFNIEAGGRGEQMRDLLFGFHGGWKQLYLVRDQRIQVNIWCLTKMH